jgi:hypothetical protein
MPRQDRLGLMVSCLKETFECHVSFTFDIAGKLEGGKKGGLFYDVRNLSNIWNHPYILVLSKVP